MTRRPGLAIGLAIGLLLLWSERGAAQSTLPATKMRFAERGGQLTVYTDVTGLFDGASYNQLDNGFPATVVVRLWVYPHGSQAGQAQPVAFALLRRRVVYDLWDEVYVVRIDEPTGTRELRIKYKAEALKALSVLDATAIASLASIPYEKVFQLAIVAELNPVSKETLAEARRWLGQGAGGGLERGGSFFGSFVSVFVNLKIPQADRVLRLRSQPFYRPTPKPPIAPALAPANKAVPRAATKGTP